MSNRRTSTILMNGQEVVIHEDYCLMNSSAAQAKAKQAQTSTPAAPQKQNRKWFQRGINTLDWLQEKGQILINILRNYAAWIVFLSSVAASAVKSLPLVFLAAVDIIVPSARLVTSLRLLHRSIFHREGKWTKGFFLLGGLSVLGLGIVAFILPSLALPFNLGTMACNAVLGLWLMGAALHNKFWGEWKKEREQLKEKQEDFYDLLAQDDNLEKYLAFKAKNYAALNKPDSFAICDKLHDLDQEIQREKNKNNDRNADLAIKAYNVAIIFVALAAISMSFFPPTLIVGAAIMVAANLHWLLLGYDIGGGWPQKIKNFFFPPSQADSNEELLKQVKARKKNHSSTAMTGLSLRDKEKAPSTKLTAAPQASLAEGESEPLLQQRSDGRVEEKSSASWPFWQNQTGVAPQDKPSQAAIVIASP